MKPICTTPNVQWRSHHIAIQIGAPMRKANPMSVSQIRSSQRGSRMGPMSVAQEQQ